MLCLSHIYKNTKKSNKKASIVWMCLLMGWLVGCGHGSRLYSCFFKVKSKCLKLPEGKLSAEDLRDWQRKYPKSMHEVKSKKERVCIKLSSDFFSSVENRCIKFKNRKDDSQQHLDEKTNTLIMPLEGLGTQYTELDKILSKEQLPFEKIKEIIEKNEDIYSCSWEELENCNTIEEEKIKKYGDNASYTLSICRLKGKKDLQTWYVKPESVDCSKKIWLTTSEMAKIPTDSDQKIDQEGSVIILEEKLNGPHEIRKSASDVFIKSHTDLEGNKIKLEDYKMITLKVIPN